ncbi:Uncharacterised protein [Mycobacteroides abscessus subsp. abscessus]|uniref:hypothetical protein n=1 Tax=Mycobacteroides abscessus TaxID=36809 RepID=UPI000928F53E|nr:hypothetical protein [Mycobacteroides abscessus]MBE5451202.1 hypothetical protein [Mycobacteroides abscessus]MDO3212627.1 hypothetical protein [Mycobacteroides abscessus subsp. abscessus]SHV87784.1 Uncharacterised protein [Mycobacteroides abscessus subsp. abscessus]SHW41225.1 Uncharacterised protein [Mycobacteroides abscessus subsp. abscessus]SIC36641.1 Uncharacterised protein [Mycobacteroides abscessus subsp. abscessus]
MDDLIGRIDDLLDDDDEPDDIPWSDAWRWAPPETELPEGVWEDQPDAELDCGWDYYPDTQIHVIPVEQVGEWARCLATLPVAEREDIQWFVVCFQCMSVGERSVDCSCSNPSNTSTSR